MSNQAKMNRRDVFRLTGGVAGAAALSAIAPVATASQNEARPSRGKSRGVAQEDMDHGAEARFVYTGTYTRGAPGGWSGVASANRPEGVGVFSAGAGMGDLKLIQTIATDNPSWVTIHPSGDFLYVSNEIGDYEDAGKGSLEAYSIDNETGELTFINRVGCGSIPAQIVVSPGGDYLAVATYVGGTYEIFPIGEDGSLGEASSVLQQEGSGPDLSRQEAPHCHAVVFDPSGNYIAGADLGTDWVKVFTYADGELVEVSAAMVAEGSGPRHLAFHPDGEILYVICELTATITSFAFDPATGALGEELQTISTMPQGSVAHCAEIMVHPSGQFLYGSNRHAENHPLADSIVAYSIDEHGHLRLIGYTTTPDVIRPRGFAIDPTGTWLYIMGQKTDQIVQFHIDPHSGSLTPTGNVTTAMVPVSMAFKA